VECGGEKEGLPLFRKPIHDPAHLREETQVQHAVYFVEHQVLDVAQFGRAILEEIQQAARCCDEHIHARFQELALLP